MVLSQLVCAPVRFSLSYVVHVIYMYFTLSLVSLEYAILRDWESVETRLRLSRAFSPKALARYSYYVRLLDRQTFFFPSGCNSTAIELSALEELTEYPNH